MKNEFEILLNGEKIKAVDGIEELRNTLEEVITNAYEDARRNDNERNKE